MPLRRKRTFSNSSESISAGNILNGVLDCKWNRTSATPSLLEIANTSEVKFNISQMTPLVLRFADGWDDIDQPKGVVKKITTPPPNINLSDKANCHVQIVAKVINDEVVITTHTTYDPAVGYGSNIVPLFNSGYVDASPFDASTDWKSTKNGWEVFCGVNSLQGNSYPRYAVDGDNQTAFQAASWNTPDLNLRLPYATWFSKITAYISGSYSDKAKCQAYDSDLGTWVDLAPSTSSTGNLTFDITSQSNPYSHIRLLRAVSQNYSAYIRSVAVYEFPTAKYFRSLNKVKDRSDNEQLWINLGYATIDGSGNITALNHYTDMRNNYPGGMRVEP